MAELTLPPDYFRTAADRYNQNPTNRKVWLQDQISRANSSLLQYQAELLELGMNFEEIKSAKGSAGAVQTVGAVVAAIPAGFTQIVGGVLLVAGSFFSKLENKQKTKALEQQRLVGIARYNEAVQVAKYKTAYENELLFLKLLPVVLTAIFIWLITK